MTVMVHSSLGRVGWTVGGTPTAMGAIPEAFGRHAEELTKDHALEFCEGKGTPFEKLYDLDAFTLLLGVGFNRCSSLHYAESLVANRRTTSSRFPMEAFLFSTRDLVDFAKSYFSRALAPV
jgi:aminoglycoside N3'-acetyltransferase